MPNHLPERRDDLALNNNQGANLAVTTTVANLFKFLTGAFRKRPGHAAVPETNKGTPTPEAESPSAEEAQKRAERRAKPAGTAPAGTAEEIGFGTAFAVLVAGAIGAIAWCFRGGYPFTPQANQAAAPAAGNQAAAPAADNPAVNPLPQRPHNDGEDIPMRERLVGEAREAEEARRLRRLTWLTEARLRRAAVNPLPQQPQNNTEANDVPLEVVTTTLREARLGWSEADGNPAVNPLSQQPRNNAEDTDATLRVVTTGEVPVVKATNPGAETVVPGVVAAELGVNGLCLRTLTPEGYRAEDQKDIPNPEVKPYGGRRGDSTPIDRGSITH